MRDNINLVCATGTERRQKIPLLSQDEARMKQDVIRNADSISRNTN